MTKDFSSDDLLRVLLRADQETVADAIRRYYEAIGRKDLAARLTDAVQVADVDAGSWVIEAYADAIGLGKPVSFVLSTIDRVAVAGRRLIIKAIFGK